MHDLTNFKRLSENPQFVEEKRRMATHFRQPSFLSLLQQNLLCYESFQLINDSYTSTIKHWNRHKMSALQTFSYISLPLSVKVPRFHFKDTFFLILKSKQHLICYVSKFSLFHLYIHYHTVLRIYGYPVGPNTLSSSSWQISRSYHVYFCIQRNFFRLSSVQPHIHSQIFTRNPWIKECRQRQEI
jgi:hypothetical protein